jgi:hypothetical protein
MADPNAAGYCTNGGTNCGYNVNASSSEMAHLFFSTLGNRSALDAGGLPQAGSGLTNTATFQNLQSYDYWLGTVDVTNPNGAWYFYTTYGYQARGGKDLFSLYAMAVHSGDVGSPVTPVPEPETYAMLLAGLGLVAAVARRRNPGSASRSTPCES